MIRKICRLFLFIPIILSAQLNKQLQFLAKDFWEWRSITQPVVMDDIPRIERPDYWKPDFSPAAIENIINSSISFKKRLYEIDKSQFNRADSVDYLCLRSCIERVNWEIKVLQIPFRNPDFYIQQTIGALYELLVQQKAFDNKRVENFLVVLNSIPATIENAKQNLHDPIGPFTNIALENLSGVREKLLKVNKEMAKLVPISNRKRMDESFKHAIIALENYQNWLIIKLPSMKNEFSPGKEAYKYFLKNIALVPYSPEEILNYGRLELTRAVTFEELENEKNIHNHSPKVFSSIAEQIEQSRKDEISIRDFLVEKNLFSIPEWLKHYSLSKTPAFLEPLTYIGESDDFTSESRLDCNSVRYIVPPDSNLSFFPLSLAKDPRPVIIHEGIPGHYFQLALSWKNPDPIRRRFIDSGSNEGIGFYVEEMMLQVGFFDGSPYAKEIIYKFMRLRALRVEADIQLALGNFSIEDAADYLAKTVPMDTESAISSAYFYAYNPGQAISYQIGKIQILKFLNDAKIKLGQKFDLKKFHDYLVNNGNVPISLLRWEYLGLTDEVKQFFNN